MESDNSAAKAYDEALDEVDAAQYEFFCAAMENVDGDDLLAVARRLAAAIRLEIKLAKTVN